MLPSALCSARRPACVFTAFDTDCNYEWRRFLLKLLESLIFNSSERGTLVNSPIAVLTNGKVNNR